MVYVVTDWSGAVKIGYARQLSQRMVAMQTGNPRQIEVLMTMETESLETDRKLEKLFHSEFGNQAIKFEDGHVTEWFDDSVLSYICDNTAEFISRFCRKYDFRSDIKFHYLPHKKSVEKRRIDNLKSVMTKRNFYEIAEKHAEEPEEPIVRNPLYQVGDLVRLKPGTTTHYWFESLYMPIKTPTRHARVVSVIEDKETGNFSYRLDSGFQYAEEELRRVRNAETRKGEKQENEKS